MASYLNDRYLEELFVTISSTSRNYADSVIFIISKRQMSPPCSTVMDKNSLRQNNGNEIAARFEFSDHNVIQMPAAIVLIKRAPNSKKLQK